MYKRRWLILSRSFLKMRVRYCCDTAAYENYYLNQVGSGYFSGPRTQTGFGLANIFSSIAKTVVPLLKSGAKAVGKQVLRGGVDFANDVFSGKNVKQAAIDRASAAGQQLVKQAQSKMSSGTLFSRPAKKRKKPSRLQKRKHKRKRDIFS